MIKDQELFIINLINKEKKRQERSVELIASENYVSNEVMNAIGSVLTNKYAEGYPGKRYYSGCFIIDKIEQICIDLAKKLFNVDYANVQPHSGTQANASVYMSCLKPGDTILGFDIYHGGHLSHGAKVNFSGILYRSIFYGLKKNTELIDYDKMIFLAKKEKPKLIICGASAYSRDIDYSKFREAADSVGALLLADISHTSGLIAKGLLNNPFKYCHFVTSTTHKTLRGPRGGIILINKDFEIKKKRGSYYEKKNIFKIMNNSVFPGCQGGPHQNIIAAKALALNYVFSKKYYNYANQIILNAKVLSNFLINKGYKIISGGTDNHCILIDLSNKNITGLEAQQILESVDINCNKNMIPFDDKSPFITSGIRLGTPAITTRGLKEHDIYKIASFIDYVLSNRDNFLKLKLIKLDINKMMKNFPLYSL